MAKDHMIKEYGICHHMSLYLNGKLNSRQHHADLTDDGRMKLLNYEPGTTPPEMSPGIDYVVKD